MHHQERTSRNFFIAFRRWTLANATPSQHHSHYTNDSVAPAAHKLRAKAKWPPQIPPKILADRSQLWTHIRVPWLRDRKVMAKVIDRVILPQGGTCWYQNQDIILTSRSSQWLDDAFSSYKDAFQVLTGASGRSLALRMGRLDGTESGTMMLSQEDRESNNTYATERLLKEGAEQTVPTIVWVTGQVLLNRSLKRLRNPGTRSGWLPGGVKYDLPIKDDIRFIAVWAKDISALFDALHLDLPEEVKLPEHFRTIRFIEPHVSSRSKPYTDKDYYEMYDEFRANQSFTTEGISSPRTDAPRLLAKAAAVDSAISSTITPSTSQETSPAAPSEVASAATHSAASSTSSTTTTTIVGPELTVLDTADASEPEAISSASSDVDLISDPAGQELQSSRLLTLEATPDILRSTLSRMTNSVVLITAYEEKDNSSQAFRGVTVSSFTAVTVDPTPFISFNIKVPSRTYTAFKQSGKICVHILAANEAGTAIANAFTKRYEEASEPFYQLSHAGAKLIQEGQSPPRIDYQDGVIAWLDCGGFGSSTSHTVGDHEICVFIVQKVGMVENSESDAKKQQLGLAYASKQYRMAEAVPATRSLAPKIRNPDPNDAILAKQAELQAQPEDKIRNEAPEQEKQPQAPIVTKVMEEASLLKASGGIERRLPLSEAADRFLTSLEQEVGIKQQSAAKAEDSEIQLRNLLERQAAIRAAEEAMMAEQEAAAKRLASTQATRERLKLLNQVVKSTNSTSPASSLITSYDAPAHQDGAAALARLEAAQRQTLAAKIAPHQLNATPLSTTQRVSQFHTMSRIWQLDSMRHSSSLAAPFRKVLPREMQSANDDQAANDNQSNEVARSEEIIQEPDNLSSTPIDLSTTVNDFLCHSFVKHSKRTSRLYNMRTVTEKAEDKLKRELAAGTLTVEMSEKLEGLIASNERFIAWTLAERAAFDLREMLDQGRIVQARISFIEGCIEKGQRAIYEEAQAIMIGLEKKYVTIEWYEKRQKLLVETEAVLRDELVRLRAFYEDDDKDDW